MLCPRSYFNSIPEKKCENFLVITSNEQLLENSFKETQVFCPIVVKGLMNAKTIDDEIPEEVGEILKGFKDLTANDLPSDLP